MLLFLQSSDTGGVCSWTICNDLYVLTSTVWFLYFFRPKIDYIAMCWKGIIVCREYTLRTVTTISRWFFIIFWYFFFLLTALFFFSLSVFSFYKVYVIYRMYKDDKASHIFLEQISIPFECDTPKVSSLSLYNIAGNF